MLLKSADDKSKDVTALEALLKDSRVTAEVAKKIERELRNVRSGMRGEAEAAYELDFHFTGKNWMVIHDLRLEHAGRVAQIDHLLINRFLEFYVCESKRFGEGVAINEEGEFSAFFAGRPYGIASPIEQNKRHMVVLEALIADGRIGLPTRLGMQLKPRLHGYVLVSKEARIARPGAHRGEFDSVIKVDQFVSRLNAQSETGSVLSMAKLIGTDTLEALARQIVALHVPLQFDWAAKFGLTKDVAPEATRPALPEGDSVSPSAERPQKSKLVCADCGVSVSYVVAKFCWSHRKFGGKVYCRGCQGAH